MNTTRKEFISALTAAGISTAFGVSKKKKDEFQDIRVDRYYVLHGGQYGSTGGIGWPGVSEGSEMTEVMNWHVYCQDLDDWISNVEKNGYYFEVSGFFDSIDAKPIGKIQLNRDWLMKFYELHKNDTKQDWEDKYNKYLESLSKL